MLTYDWMEHDWEGSWDDAFLMMDLEIYEHGLRVLIQNSRMTRRSSSR